MNILILTTALLSAITMCKMSQCNEEVAGPHENFCKNHLCTTEGCKKAVKVGGMPGWMQPKQNKNQFVQPGQKQEKYEPPRLVWQHCPEHTCNRNCPRGENVAAAFENVDEDTLISRAACKDERLYKGKYCATHTCAVKGCFKQVFEKWPKAEKTTGTQQAPSRSYEDLESSQFCMQHLKLKDTNFAKHTEKELETVTARSQRLAAEKAAAAEAKAAKAAAAAEAKSAANATETPAAEE